MRLYVVRHAIAEERGPEWPDDFDRPLSAEGAAKYRKAASGAGRILSAPDRVLCSPYVRAWQTAELLADVAGWPEPEECPQFAAHVGAELAMELIEELLGGYDDVVALVGHEPNCSAICALLTERQSGIGWFKKGAIAELVHDGDSWSLARYLPPKSLITA